MRIGIDGSCLSNRRGFGRFARRLVEAMARRDTPHRFTVFVDGPSAGTVEVPDGFRAGRGGRGRGAQPGGVGAGASAVARHDRHGTRRRASRAGRHVLPGDLQLLPGVERGPAGRDDARHAAAVASRAGLPPAGRSDRLAAQGGGGGAVGRPDRDGLRGLPPRDPGLAGPARPADPGHHRGARPDLRAAARPAPSRTPSSAGTGSGRANGTCSTWADSARTRTCPGWSRRSRGRPARTSGWS